LSELIEAGAIDASIFTFLGVADEQGDLMLGNIAFQPTNLADREHFLFHRRHATQDVFIGKPLRGRVSGKWSFHLSRRIDKPDGSFGGIVIAALDPAYFTGFYEQANLGAEGFVMLVGTDGIARARKVGPVSTFGQDMRESTLFVESLKSRSGDFLSTGKLDGKRRFVSYRTITEYPLLVAVARSEDEALAEYGRRAFAYYLSAALASALIALFGTGLMRALAREKRIAAAMRESDAQYRATFSQAAVGIAHTDMQGRFLRVNQRLCDMLGYAEEELTGMRFRHVGHSGDLPALRQDKERLLAGEQKTLAREIRYVRKDGSMGWVNRGLSLVRDPSGRPHYFISVLEDVTARRELQNRLLHLAHFDELTRLPNRVLCHDRLRQALNLARRSKWIVGLLLVDLDRFTVINDTLGHATGDRILRDVAARLTRALAPHHTVARFGGDEFAVVLPDLARASDIEPIVRSIVSGFEEPWRDGQHAIFLTVSIGIAAFPDDGADAEALLGNAEAALHHAKKSGMNKYEFYTRELSHQAMARMLMQNGLRHALARGEYSLRYQPRVSFGDGRITGCEALLRWHTDGEAISPAQFIPLLEESGLILPVGEWVIRAACMQIRDWRRANVPAVPIAVNLSAKQLQQGDICAVVERALQDSGVEAGLLELEVTESVAMHDAQGSVKTLQRLKAAGLRISIDDFGTGYSSLSYLKRFPVDSLKLDRSFVAGLPDDADDASIANAVITMAHSLDLSVVAEGVETPAQQAFLARAGCDEMQGFLFSHPLEAEEITRLLWVTRERPRQLRAVW